MQLMGKWVLYIRITWTLSTQPGDKMRGPIVFCWSAAESSPWAGRQVLRYEQQSLFGQLHMLKVGYGRALPKYLSPPPNELASGDCAVCIHEASAKLPTVVRSIPMQYSAVLLLPQ